MAFDSVGAGAARGFRSTFIPRKLQAEEQKAQLAQQRRLQAKASQEQAREDAVKGMDSAISMMEKVAENGALDEQSVNAGRQAFSAALESYVSTLETNIALGRDLGIPEEQLAPIIQERETFLRNNVPRFGTSVELLGRLAPKTSAEEGAASAEEKIAEAERLGQFLGVSAESLLVDDPSERQQKIAELVELGHDPKFATDLVNGFVKISTTPDAQGMVTITNLRTNQAFQIPARGVGPEDVRNAETALVGPADDAAPAASAGAPSGGEGAVTSPDAGIASSVVADVQGRQANRTVIQNEFDDARRALIAGATGPLSNVQAGLTKFASIFGFGGFTENEVNRGLLRTFREDIIALSKNPRIPEAQAQRLIALAPDPARFFVNRRNELGKLAELERFVANQDEIDKATLENRAPNLLPPLQHGTRSNRLSLPENVDAENAEAVREFLNSQTHLSGVTQIWFEDARGRRGKFTVTE